MARRRIPADTAAADVVPAELLDHASLAWRDGKLFVEWLRRHAPGQAMPTGRHLEYLLRVGWNYKFDFAASAWAAAHGIKLADQGVVRVSSLERSAAMHGTDLPLKIRKDAS